MSPPANSASSHEIDRDTQLLLARKPVRPREVHEEAVRLHDAVEAYSKVVEAYREIFATEVIGRFDNPLLPPNPRSRQDATTRRNGPATRWCSTSSPTCIAYGILCLPKDLKPGEKRPVVVCQHGLEGRPQDTIGEQGSQYYTAFAGKLAERGFITFAPQNLYIGKDRFRTLQRKANPLGKTLFSIIVPQHQQICNWLKTLPFVDGERIAFYGLSYGGKSAMRIPPLVPDYCLSICSADFNEWVGKNASTRAAVQLRLDRRVRDLRVRPGQHVQLRRDGRPDRPAAVHGRARALRRRRRRRVGRARVRQGAASSTAHRLKHRRPLRDRSGSTARTRSTARGRIEFLHKHLKWPEPK